MAKMPKTGSPAPPRDPEPFRPCAERTVRVLARPMDSAVAVAAHSHPWAQAVFSDTGVLRVTLTNVVYMVPARHAVLIPPGTEHCALLLKDACLFSVYLHLPDGACQRPPWDRCRVVRASGLLLELVRALAGRHCGAPQSYRALCLLVQEQLRDACEVKIGVPIPAERRLHSLCQTFLAAPRQDTPFAQLASDAGLSLSTATRLFRTQLGMGFGQWRQQALIARALALAAEGRAMQAIAGELGYANASAFSAMVTRTFGIPPRELLLHGAGA